MEKSVLLALGVSFLLVVVLSKLKSFRAIPKLNLPPGPWTLPVIGSIHHLIGGQNICRAMRGLARKHGPLMQVWFGELPAVVASSPEAAEAILRTHDLAFADRYCSTTLRTITFDAADMAFAPYGERWRQLRKICVLEALGAAKVRSSRRVREEEASRMVLDLAAASSPDAAAVDLTGRMAKLVNDTVVRASIGGRCEHRDEFLDALATSVSLSSGMNVADVFPSWRLMRVLGSSVRRALDTRRRMKRIIEQVIQERKEFMAANSCGEGEPAADECFLDVLLRLQREGSSPIQITNDTMVALLFDMFAGGTETTATALNWTMAELIRSPRVMAKVQAEVRLALQGKNTVTEDDITELTYLKMVIKEALRLHCPVPFLGPRKCRETCQVMGYDILKDTTVLVNVWAICRDSKYWDEPEEFKPERFEDSTIDFKGTYFEFLPFGAGRRMCTGVTQGLASMEIALASLLYHFDWKLPNGMDPKDVDMEDAPGIVSAKRTRLLVYPITRIPPSNA
uniref:Cytochrome P450 n=1 Tax=Oryza punctata TaxID=4537 RepID=A0A0E0M6Y1_ORYPU